MVQVVETLSALFFLRFLIFRRNGIAKIREKQYNTRTRKHRIPGIIRRLKIHGLQLRIRSRKKNVSVSEA